MADKNFERAKQITLKLSEPLFSAIERLTDNKQKWLKDLAEREVRASGDKKYEQEVLEYLDKKTADEKAKFLSKKKR